MGRMLDALKNLEAEEAANRAVSTPVPSAPAPTVVAATLPANPANPDSVAQGARTIGASFLAKLASSQVSPAAPIEATTPGNTSSPSSPGIANAAATLARLKASVNRAAPSVQPSPVAVVTAPISPDAPLAASMPTPMAGMAAAPGPASEAVAAVVAYPETAPQTPIAASPPAQSSASSVSPAPEIQLPSPRTARTRMEETVQAALNDPRRTVPLEQLVRRMRTELRADNGRCWLLADAGQHHDSADLAAHLGPIFASQLGEVLLIDGSLDCALLSAGMSSLDRPGLAQVATGAKTWHSLIQPTAWQNLFLLPAGQIVGEMPDPTAAWTNMLSQAERRFRLVLVDGGAATDPSCKALGRLCDATYLVIRLGMTEARQARQAMQQLRAGGARVIGSIATSVPPI